MTTTVRLLSYYDGNPFNTIVRLPDALAATFVAQGNATLDLTGGINRPPSLPTRANRGPAQLIYSSTGQFLGLGDTQNNLLLSPSGATLPGGLTAPGAPTGLTLTALAGGISAAFTAPTNNGGDAELRYKLVLSNGIEVTGGSSPIAAASPAGLAVTGVLYAVNGVGTSPASNTSNSVTPTGVAPSVPATAITLTGPTTATVGTASSAYTVALSPVGGTVASPVTVTPTPVTGVTFAPTSVQLTTASPSATFTATATTAGTKAIAVTSTGGLTAPAAINLVVSAAAEVATLRQVADRSFFPTDVATQTKALFSSTHTAMDNLTALDIGYALFATQDETTTDIGNVEMSIVVEYPVGSGTQTTLTQSATGAPGGVVRTGLQPLNFTIPKGSRFKIKGAFNATGARFPFCKMGSGRTFGSTYELFSTQSITNVLNRPYTESAATWNARVSDSTTSVTAQYAIMPTFILGMSTCKSIFIMGDSRSAGGSQDYVNDETLQAGAACRFLNGKVAYINASMNGDKALQWASGEHGTKRKNTALQYCTGFMNAMGTNDYPAAADTATLIALDAQIKTNVAGAAVNPYYGVTVPPTTSDSTGRYYIESAQVGNVFSPARRSLNAYRVGQVGQMYTKVFDQAATFEGVAVDKWAVASTARAQNITATAGSSQITGTFTAADDGLFCLAVGAESGSTDFLFYLQYVNATTANTLSGAGALKPVTLGGTFNTYFGYQHNTYDGIHETVGGGKRMALLGLTAAVV